MKYIPYGKQLITDDDVRIVKEVLGSTLITSGPILEEFEQKVSLKVEAQYSVAVNSATSALHIACIALGLQENDWLWSTPTTFVASTNCALYCNAKVDFVDICIETGLIDTNKLKNKLMEAKKTGKLPKIVVPVHLAGSSADMKEIKKLSDEYNFKIIEDASHAIGGRYLDTYVGSCKYSDICVFSFHPVKIITTAEGGMATTNSKILAEKMSRLRSHGIEREVEKFVGSQYSPWRYEMQDIGFNYRMNEIQAALGVSQLNRH